MPGITASELVLEGAGRARLHFGARAEPVTGSELVARGRRSFGGSAESDTFAILMTNDDVTVATLLGAIESGARIVSLPTPARTTDLDVYVAFLRDACKNQGVREIVARDDVSELLAGSGLVVRSHTAVGDRALAEPSPGGFELVQFSSGSTARPKAVQLSDLALGANLAAIMERLAPEPGDHSVSWLPLSHDMGLIGMLLTSLASTSSAHVGHGDVVVLDPFDFLRRPRTWLTAISEFAATVTAAPDFGFRMAAQSGSIGGLDLSRLRCAIVGGETIRSSTLQQFAETFAGNGFSSTSFCPAYGLAELGLAATITPVSLHWRERCARTMALAHRRFEPVPSGKANGMTTLVASGPPVSGYEVRCTGSTDEIATIAVRGPSVGVDASTGMSFADEEGWLATGDVGMVLDGWLYVTGRGDDHIVANGRNLYAPAVEDAISTVAGVRGGRVAAVGLPSGDWIVVAEPETRQPISASDRSLLAREIRVAAVGATATGPSDVVIVERGRLPMTPSGKLQRSEVVRRYVAGTLVAAGPTEHN